MSTQYIFQSYDNQIAKLLSEGFNAPDITKEILKTSESRRKNTNVRAMQRYIKRHRTRLLDEYEGIYEASDKMDVAATDVKNMWLKTKDASLFVVNPEYRKPEQRVVEEIDFEALFANIKPMKLRVVDPIEDALFDRLVYTDTHVAMLITDYSLYGGVWDEHELDKACDKMIEHVVHNRMSPVLYIDDLGDFLDGYEGQTARRSHHLPQNMDSQKAFDVGLSFKIKLVQSLIPYYEKIVCHNVCEDNHAGSFGYILNSAFKTAIEMMLPNVEVVNFRKFMDYYIVGNYTFVLSHGKDSVSLKFGFKPKLDKVQENKIDNYIDRNELGGIIEFSKGDSHQYLFDSSTAQRFNYYNYPALSPSSAWVQVNFQVGISGFVFFNYFSDRKVIHESIVNHTLTRKNNPNV